jgi:hypothetical protein
MTMSVSRTWRFIGRLEDGVLAVAASEEGQGGVIELDIPLGINSACD